MWPPRGAPIAAPAWVDSQVTNGRLAQVTASTDRPVVSASVSTDGRDSPGRRWDPRDPDATEIPGERVSAFADDALGTGDATDVAHRIASGEISAAEAVEAAIARVEAVQRRLNGLQFEDFDRARRRAATVPTRGDAVAAFAGVPGAFKDNVTVAGMPLTMGSRAVVPRRLSTDGGVVKQILDTGMIPIGSTTCPEFGWTATTERVGGDVTRNPWHTGYSSGGSSGGSAAFVASGALPIAHANDGGGSIRIPAAACGLVGLKMSRGRTLGDPSTADTPVKVVNDGVLTRSVRDTARMVAALEQRYRNPRLQPVGEVEGPGARRLRVGVTIDSPVGPATDAPTRAAVEATRALLDDLGHDTVDFAPPVPRFFKSDFEDYWALLAFAISKNGRKQFGPGFEATRLDPLTLGLAQRFSRRILKAPLVLARLQASSRAYERSIADVDLVLTPVLSHQTPPIGYLSADQPFEDHFRRLVDYCCFTPLHNATGAPAISLPLGATPDGRPVGVMFSGARGSERTLLEIAFELEAARPFASVDGSPSARNVSIS